MAFDALALLFSGTVSSAGTTAAAKSIPLLSPIINANKGLSIRLTGEVRATGAPIFSPVVQSSPDTTRWVTRGHFSRITAASAGTAGTGTVVIEQTIRVDAGSDPYLRFACPVPTPTTGVPQFIVTVSPVDSQMP